jgi:hypothetical protein
VVLTAGDFGHPEVDGQLSFADSEIVRLPDRRLRIYMYIGSPNGSGPGGIGSMVSADGLHWTLEPGNRCSQTCGQIGVVPLPVGGWRIFGGGEGGIHSATSTDGLKWVDEPGLRVSNSSFPGDAGEFLSGPHLTMVTGGWRMYFHKGDPQHWFRARVVSAFSSDLLNWTPDPGVRVTGLLHPNVVALPKGGYQMFGNAGFGVVTATSSDGLTWPATLTETGLQGGDPVPLLMPGGKIRLYYNDADAIAQKGGGLFWAEQEHATWDVTFEDSPTSPRSIQVIGSGGPVTVRLTDMGRSQDRPNQGLPRTAEPPFTVSVVVPGQLPYQPLVEVGDGTMNRLFNANGCGPGTWPCESLPSAPPCQLGQPIPPQGCITTGYDGLPKFCLPKGQDPNAPPICKEYY